jgi:hypothetical protein
LITSGIATSDPDIILAKGGTTVNLPFWKNLDTEDEDEVLSDGNGLTSSKIVANKDVAAIHLRGKSWSANDLASLLAGDDAMEAIAARVANYWAARKQKVLVKSLEGAFKAESMKDSVHDISAKEGDAGVLSADAMLDAMYLLGDAYESITGIMMHSYVMKKLAKLDLIENEKDSNGNATIPMYMGKRVIVDDMLVPADISVGGDTKKAYPIYFFGAGAVAYNEGTQLENIETDRDKSEGADYIFTRYQFTMHPRGIKWIGTPAGVTPTNAELADGANWQLAEDRKNVAITKLIARVD